MDRRSFVGSSVAASLAASLALFGAAPARAAGDAAGGGKAPAPLPKRDRVKVAFMLGDDANVIDTAGPWEVFQDTWIMAGGEHRAAFELYTVAPTTELLRMTGGLIVKPAFSIADAPQPHVIVVPAHRSTAESREWLKRASAGTDITMSICTGAYQLARAGLLDGIPATTHHEYYDDFAREFPDIELRRGLRFVDSGRIATSGGLTSGIDMTLHVVARYFGTEAAAATAAYMAYTSDAWRT